MIDAIGQGSEIVDYIRELSSELDSSEDSVAIVLAAGHGKRIKSVTSKMLHEIWGVPTVERVSNAAKTGLGCSNQIIVVGIKAREVAEALGRSSQRVLVLQNEQNGTGDAVRTAMDVLKNDSPPESVFIFPGDMGLLNKEVVRQFRSDFMNARCDMMVLTGQFEGNPEDNYYGRIVRVPEHDVNGEDANEDRGKVIEIKEIKDIEALEPKERYSVGYRGRQYSFSKEDLVRINEFNTGIFAFRTNELRAYIALLETNNTQKELYLTDLIAIFNQNGLAVQAAEAQDNRTVLGFNVKSVLKEMESFARESVYEQLKDIISIADKDDFFVADEVVLKLIALDQEAAPLDIHLGKGVYIGKDVDLSKGVCIKNHAHLSGNVVVGEGVSIEENVHLSSYSSQTMKIGKNTSILKGDIIKGNLEIGENCQIESSVNMTGSDDFPTRIGNNVVIKGTSYIFGCTVEDDLWIEHSVLKCKQVKKATNEDGTIQPVRYVLTKAEGLETISEIASNGVHSKAVDADINGAKE